VRQPLDTFSTAHAIGERHLGISLITSICSSWACSCPSLVISELHAEVNFKGLINEMVGELPVVGNAKRVLVLR